MISRGFILCGTALGGLTSGVTGLVLAPPVFVDEVSNNVEGFHKYSQTGQHLSKLSSTGKLPEPNPTPPQKLSSPELNHYYFGSWKYLSEGGKDPLYLITSGQKIKKIPASQHAQGQKDLWNGHKISFFPDGWFGPRSFKFEDLDPTKQEGSKELWVRYNKIISNLNKGELKKLSQYLNNFSDDQWCTLIDILWTCSSFKKAMISDNTLIKKGMKLELEHVLLLTKHQNLDDVWGDLSTIVDKTIHFEKIKNLQKHVSKHGVNWLKKYFQGDSDPKIDPVKLLLWMHTNKEFGFECNSGDPWEDKYFSECKESASPDKPIKVIWVLKSTVEPKDGKRYLPKKYEKGNSKQNKGKKWIDQQEMQDIDKKELDKELSKKGIYKGVLDEKCNQFKNFWNFGLNVEADFCKNSMESMFGSAVNNKRFCLYEIPEAQGYLRAYKLAFFNFTRWEKGNKFWAKCDANGH